MSEWTVGDRVRVVAGSSAGRNGTVVSVEPGHAFVQFHDGLTPPLVFGDDRLERDDDGGGSGVREPRRPRGPDHELDADEAAPSR